MNEEGASPVVHDEIVAPGAPWSARVRRGQVLRIVDLEGEQGVDFLCYDAADPRERYYAPNTIKKSGTLRLTTGHVLYSDPGRALFTIVADSCGHHDTIAGCCSAPSNAMLYGVDGVPGCRENFLAALAEHGLGWTDIVPNVNFFCAVPVHEGGRLAERTFVDGPSQARRSCRPAGGARRPRHRLQLPPGQQPGCRGPADPDPRADFLIRYLPVRGLGADRRPHPSIPRAYPSLTDTRQAATAARRVCGAPAQAPAGARNRATAGCRERQRGWSDSV